MPAFIDDKNVVHIKCEDCDAEAPPASEILKSGGLNNMGWHCIGGTYFCPNHAPPTFTCRECKNERFAELNNGMDLCRICEKCANDEWRRDTRQVP